MSVLAKSFGRMLRTKREERKWSIYELGKRSGIAAPHISAIELGKREPSTPTIEKLAEAFGYTSAIVFLPKRKIQPIEEAAEEITVKSQFTDELLTIKK